MADKTKIEWTSASWNPVRGCTRVSPGCGGANNEGGCYAEKIAARFSDPGQPFHGFAKRTSKGGRWTGKMALVLDMLELPLRWKMPRKIFVNSMSDLFHEGLTFDDIVKVFAVMAIARRHTFQVLTKRSARMREFTAWLGTNKGHSALMRAVIWLGYSVDDVPHYLPLPNVWLGVSVEDQTRADERIPDLLNTPAAVRWISAEPLLGPVDLRGWTTAAWDGDSRKHKPAARLDWVVVGGESGGKKSRPMNPFWEESLRLQCATTGTAYFRKQWGDWANMQAAGIVEDAPMAKKNGDVTNWTNRIVRFSDGRQRRVRAHSFTGHATDLVYFVGKKNAGSKLDGVVHQEWPK